METPAERRQAIPVFEMVAVAATIFLALFGFGANYFGWSDHGGEVRLALFATFVLGIVCGYKIRG